MILHPPASVVRVVVGSLECVALGALVGGVVVGSGVCTEIRAVFVFVLAVGVCVGAGISAGVSAAASNKNT